MKYQLPSRAGMVCALLSALMFATAASAKGGHEFSGYFDVSGAQEQGDLVRVKLYLRLFNHDDTDVRNVIVTLIESGPAQNFWGSFKPVKVWKRQQFIDMSQEFSVSKQEYVDWMATGRPNLVILYQDNRGKSWQKSPQMGHRPLAPSAE